MEPEERARYREVIDQLVRSCHDGQGLIGPNRAKAGVWNRNSVEALSEWPDQIAYNELLARLSKGDRDVLASLLLDQFVSGIHQTLAVLYAAQIPPFQDGYEGSPNADVAGRLDGWEWPTQKP